MHNCLAYVCSIHTVLVRVCTDMCCTCTVYKRKREVYTICTGTRTHRQKTFLFNFALRNVYISSSCRVSDSDERFFETFGSVAQLYKEKESQTARDKVQCMSQSACDKVQYSTWVRPLVTRYNTWVRPRDKVQYSTWVRPHVTRYSAVHETDRTWHGTSYSSWVRSHVTRYSTVPESDRTWQGTAHESGRTWQGTVRQGAVHESDRTWQGTVISNSKGNCTVSIGNHT